MQINALRAMSWWADTMPVAFQAQYDRPVPRYTSYPTAPNFHAAIGLAAYRRWLGALDPGEAISLYLHVPFCAQLCWYCGCHTRVVTRYRPVAGYRAVLLREIDLVAELLPSRFRARQIHWGGGTPTVLSPDDFLALNDRLRLRFDMAPDAEIAVEIDPRTLNDGMVAALAQAGVERASLGVQDFDASVQRAVNRWQPYEVTAAAVERLRRAGIDRLNFDLMYGLPLQTVAGILANVDLAVGLKPQRIAMFGYAHVPWMKRHQRLLDERQLPVARARWDQAAAAALRLEDHGYRWIGLDHFARPDDCLARAARNGTMRRNFQGYTTDSARALIGLGPSAIGSLPQGYVQNASDLRAWRNAIGGGETATSRGIALTHDDRLRRYVIERLMCDLAVDLGAAAAAFACDRSVFARQRPALEGLAADGLVALDGERVRLTPLGRPLMRIVAAVFDQYLDRGTGRHARAV